MKAPKGKIFAFLASWGFYYIPLKTEHITGSDVGGHTIKQKIT